MNPSEDQNLESYVPVYDAAPSTWEQARPFIVEQLKRLANAVNIREIGWFLDQELLSGKSFIPGMNQGISGGSSQQTRSILRKVVDFGPLPNTTTKSVPHGIFVDANFSLIQLFASATDPTNLQALPIPYVGVTTDDVSLYMDQTNININTKSDRTSFTRCFVIIEYIQEL